MHDWYVLYTKARQESVAQVNLERQGFEVYLPRVEITKRRKGALSCVIEPFFPRYLFIRFDRENDNWAPINSTKGVCGLVRFAGTPRPVSPSLINALKNNETANELQRREELAWEYGETVEIEEGLFAGYSCIFRAEKSAERVSVLLDIAGRQSQMTIPKANLHLPQYS